MEVRFEKVVKRYGDVTAVQELDLHIQDGEFLVLLGPSGCGKTTTLRMLAGLEEVTAGEIHLGDRAITRVPPQRRDIAMVFQSYALYPHMTVAENIGYPLRVRHERKEEIARRVAELAGKVGLGELLERKPRELSGGQRQRVALARAMIRQPNAFLMDEPLSNLDANVRVQMRAELKHLQHQLRTTTLYVTHDQVEAMTLAHRVAVMKDGVLQQVDAPENIYHRPANLFVAGFIGSPAMNFLPGRVDRAEQVFASEAGTIPLPGKMLDLAGKTPEAILGIRPENVALSRRQEDGWLPAQVYVSEMMGSETLVVLRAGQQKITARAGPQETFDFEEPIWFSIDSSRAHLFEPVTGLRLDSQT